MASPLDLQAIFVNDFAGGAILFVLIATAVVGALAARFRMPNIIFADLMVLFCVMMGIFAGWLYAIGILILGLVGYYILGRFARA